MEELIKFQELITQKDFFDILKIHKAIIYFLVDWSGQERISRSIINQALNEFDKLEIPIFKVDCSDQSKDYLINWLIEQQGNKKDFYYGGYGETLLIENGEIADFIKYPGQLGLVKTKEILKKWANTSTNKNIIASEA